MESLRFTIRITTKLHGGMVSNKDLCAYHNAIEPITDDTYLVCNECLHAWQTEADFLADCGKEAKVINNGNEKWLKDPFNATVHTADSVADSNVCPLCTHDF